MVGRESASTCWCLSPVSVFDFSTSGFDFGVLGCDILVLVGEEDGSNVLRLVDTDGCEGEEERETKRRETRQF